MLEEDEYRYRGIGDAYWEEIEEKIYSPYVSLEQVNNLKARQKQLSYSKKCEEYARKCDIEINLKRGFGPL